MFQPLLLLLPLGLAASAIDDGAVASEGSILPPPSGWSTFWWGDYDADGLADAWVVRAGARGRLLRNAGDGAFEDVTERAGLPAAQEAHLALWGDFDGDQRLDLFLGAWNQPSRLLRQSAPGSFSDVTREAGLGEASLVVDAEWRDYDGDGALDLHLSTLAEEVLYHNVGRGRFEKVVLQLPEGSPFADRFGRPLGPDEARRQRALAPVVPGEDGPTTSAPGTSVSHAGGATASSGIAICASSVEDFANPGVCMQASSIPTLGMLYPLSSELYVDAATGRVGVGTTAPGVRLDVASGDVRTTNRFVSTLTSGAPLVVSSSSLVANLNADKLDGFEATAFSQLGNQIETSELANNAVTNAKLNPGAVNSASVQDDSLTAADLATDSVGKQELAANAVGSSEVVDESLTSDDLAPDSVTASELAAGSVTSTEIVNGSILNAHVNAGAAIAGNKIVPNFGTQTITGVNGADISASGTNPAYAIHGDSNQPSTGGYLGVQGLTDYDGVSTADWVGMEIGAAGISVGAGATDNVGLIGHSNGAGVRGEFSGSPTLNYAELGLSGIGLHAVGAGLAADLDGAVDVAVNTTDYPGFTLLQNGTSRAAAFTQDSAGTVNDGLSIETNSSNSLHTSFRALHTGAGSAGVASFENTNAANTGTNTYIYSAGSGMGLHVQSDNVFDREMRLSHTVNPHAINLDMLQIDVINTSSVSGQFIECERGTDVEFRVDIGGDVFADGAFTGPADFAEMIQVSSGAASVEAGDVIVIDPDGNRQVRKSASAYSTLVAGVYSTKPGFVGSERDFTVANPNPGSEAQALQRQDMATLYDEVPVAVVGIVPCKVSTENGPIRPGTLLVTSSTAGHAMGDVNPPVGTVVGKALEAWDGSQGRFGTIKILVTLQ